MKSEKRLAVKRNGSFEDDMATVKETAGSDGDVFWTAEGNHDRVAPLTVQLIST
jgi:hypothetical protein